MLKTPIQGCPIKCINEVRFFFVLKEKMAANYGVIAWKMQGGESLNPEEIEVCKLSKLIIKDATIPRPGITVNLQFMQTLWEGTILSIHGMNNSHLHP